MILVDSGVWIDYFNGTATPESDILDSLLGVEPVGVGDIMLTEVLQGFRSDADYRIARSLLSSLEQFDLLGRDIALRAADNFRFLRKRGVTVRKTIDVVIATFCIENNLPLLFADRDFRPFVDQLGLQSASHGHS